MKRVRVIALVVGCLLLLPGLGLLLGGGGVASAYLFGRDGQGYLTAPSTSVQSPTAAITIENLPVTAAGVQSPAWLVKGLQTDVRLRVTGAGATPLFVGVAPAAEVNAYLRGVAHDEIVRFADRGAPVYSTSAGGAEVTAPTAQSFWTAQASGVGTQDLTWRVTDGAWAVVVMNAGGAPAVTADVTAGIRAGFLLTLALILLAVGALTTAGAIALVVFGVRGRRAGGASTGGVDSGGFAQRNMAGKPAYAPATTAPRAHPVALTARLDPGLSRWQWLVKWFLAIPHLVVLAFLWPAFIVLTVVAGVSILLTGIYPRALFDFNVGVLRWSWRVCYYATSGGLGTDRYPPFSLRGDADYPAALEIAYPQRLSRGLVLIKWLLGVPQYLIVGLLAGGWWGWTSNDGQSTFNPLNGGLLGLLVLVAGLVLLFSGSYPRALFAVIIGCNRWIYRVVAYAALMTDDYPPFRLDQGGTEPAPPPLPPTTTGPPAVRTPEPAGSRGGS